LAICKVFTKSIYQNKGLPKDNVKAFEVIQFEHEQHQSHKHSLKTRPCRKERGKYNSPVRSHTQRQAYGTIFHGGNPSLKTPLIFIG
jgi:hypothetical protein